MTETVADTATPTAVQLLDPHTLLLDRNVRGDAQVDRDFIASVRDNGVLVPIVAVRTTEGGVRVRFGHRRTLAAIEAGRPTIPVIVAADEGTDDAAQVERLVSQYAENEHRTGLTRSDQVAVIAQLSAFGVTAAQIAKRTRVPRAHVDAALTIARSDLASAAATRYGGFLDLLQAAAVAEFEDDPEAVKTLVAAARTGQFDHTVQRLRDDRDETQRREQVAARLREAGLTVVERPGWQDTTKELSSLRSDDGTPLDEQNHRGCPGHAAYVATLHGYLDAATGEPIPGDSAMVEEYDDEDEEGYDDPGPCVGGHDDEPEPADEEPAGPRPQWGSYLAPRYVCLDPKTHGHVDRYRYDSGSERKKAADMTEAERDAARAERRDVIESNRAWASAEAVRREWLRGFLARKTAPKGTAAFVATALATDAEIVAAVGGNHLTADLLGCLSPGYGRSPALTALIEEATEARAQVLVLAQVLGGYEDRTDRGDWRRVRDHTARYLSFLAANGYERSNVERRACGDRPLPTDGEDGTA